MPRSTRGRSRARLLAVLAATSAALLCTPAAASAQAPATDQVGLSTHLFWLGESDAQANMARLRSGGVGWIREDFRWDQIEPAKGDFRWGRTDALMAAAARTGTSTLAILDYSARWASSDPSGAGDVHYPPKDFADYANFARKVVERYGSDGTFWASRPDLPYRPLGAVELWNEPWGAWFWKPNPDPAAYARLVRAAATEIRAAKPDMKILVSGDLIAIRNDGRGARWLEPMLAADPGLASLFDAYSTHPYPSPRNRGPLDTTSGPEYRFDRAHITRDLAAARNASKPIWITEIGWSTAASVPDAVSEATQAAFVGDAVRHALLQQRVEKVFVFGWDKSNGIATDREGNYGLQRHDGSLKPAWSALTGVVAAGVPSPAPTVTPSSATTAAPAPATTTAPAPAPASKPRRCKRRKACATSVQARASAQRSAKRRAARRTARRSARLLAHARAAR